MPAGLSRFPSPAVEGDAELEEPVALARACGIVTAARRLAASEGPSDDPGGCFEPGGGRHIRDPAHRRLHPKTQHSRSDLGACWEHDVVLERLVRIEPGQPTLRCVAFAGDCPLEHPMLQDDDGTRSPTRS